MSRPDSIRTILRLLESAPPGVLATIATVRGSSPAPALSRLFVSSLGETVGTVGGGCLEAEVVREAQKIRAEFGWRRLAFSLTEAEEDLRMVCGGTVEILLERIDAADEPLLQLLAERHGSGQTSLLVRLFGADAEARGAAGAPTRLLLGEEGELLWGNGALPAAARGDALRAIHDERAAWSDEGRAFLEPVVGRPRLVLFGGGHVSRAVAQAAQLVGFRIAVADDREKYASEARFPDAERIVAPEYRDLAALVPLEPHDYVLVCTRGHQFDEAILDQILRIPPVRYIGVIGSRRKHLAAERNLTEQGIPAERFRGLHAPVGLEIGAVTPEEIAVSIVAEVIAVRRRARADAARSLSGAKSEPA